MNHASRENVAHGRALGAASLPVGPWLQCQIPGCSMRYVTDPWLQVPSCRSLAAGVWLQRQAHGCRSLPADFGLEVPGCSIRSLAAASGSWPQRQIHGCRSLTAGLWLQLPGCSVSFMAAASWLPMPSCRSRAAAPSSLAIALTATMLCARNLTRADSWHLTCSGQVPGTAPWGTQYWHGHQERPSLSRSGDGLVGVCMLLQEVTCFHQ